MFSCVCDFASVQHVVKAASWVSCEWCPLMPPHTHSQTVLYLSHAEDFGVGPLPRRLLYVNFMHVTPAERKRSRGRRQSGSDAATSSHCVTHSISLNHFHAPPFIPSPRKHFFRRPNPTLFFFFFFFFLRWLSSEHWFLLPDCSVTASPHLIIHKMQKFETKWNCFFISVSFVLGHERKTISCPIWWE